MKSTEGNRQKGNIMDLKDTIEMMNSEDYKERFKAEYYQLKIRYLKLKNMMYLWDNGKLGFIPDSPRSMYETQLKAMQDYLIVLGARANIENIEL